MRDLGQRKTVIQDSERPGGHTQNRTDRGPDRNEGRARTDPNTTPTTGVQGFTSRGGTHTHTGPNRGGRSRRRTNRGARAEQRGPEANEGTKVTQRTEPARSRQHNEGSTSRVHAKENQSGSSPRARATADPPGGGGSPRRSASATPTTAPATEEAGPAASMQL